MLGRLLASPAIKLQAEFTVRLLVPPGQLYDPFFMAPYDGGILLADAGGREGERGGRLVSIGRYVVCVPRGIATNRLLNWCKGRWISAV